MSQDITIKVENLSKQYRVGEIGTGTLSHDLNRWWHLVRGKEDPYARIGETNVRSEKGTGDYVWALNNINLEVKRGEVLGIIGKNGAGKSTLLKILSKVTGPTTGEISMKGRVASLLEVGTGFHSELTGRENIYLNGAILGMSKAEVTRKIDEIIEFAGVSRYIDTPVKRYSSGMKVRLGFAVAAHLEPELLIVDEVLAVGDAEFQKKAVGKMQDVTDGGGRTVMFVSHNMTSIKRLCTRCVVLENGHIVFNGTSEEAVHFYLERASETIDQTGEFNFPKDLSKNVIEFQKLTLSSIDGQPRSVYSSEEPITIKVLYKVLQKIYNMRVNTQLLTEDETVVFTTTTHSKEPVYKQPGSYSCEYTIPPNLLNQGTYKLTFASDIPNSAFLMKKRIILQFKVEKTTSSTAKDLEFLAGVIAPEIEWKLS